VLKKFVCFCKGNVLVTLLWCVYLSVQPLLSACMPSDGCLSVWCWYLCMYLCAYEHWEMCAGCIVHVDFAVLHGICILLWICMMCSVCIYSQVLPFILRKLLF
jgi:hypothetical protein